MFREVISPWIQMARYLGFRWGPARSHAADREDLAVLALLGPVRSFLDVGANDGRTCSNTLYFSLRGASGTCLEPDPANFRRLRALYRLNRRVRCLEVGLSRSPGTATLRCDGLLSSIEGNRDPGLEALLADSLSPSVSLRTIALTTLAGLAAEGVAELPVDLLSVDVEGHEYEVLLGNDWEGMPRPARCILLETHARGGGGSWRHRDFDAIARLLESHEYVRVCASANNTFWLDRYALEPTRLAAARRLYPDFEWMEPCA